MSGEPDPTLQPGHQEGGVSPTPTAPTSAAAASPAGKAKRTRAAKKAAAAKPARAGTKIRYRTSTWGAELGDTTTTDAATAADLVASRLADPA